jgi:hypothetical protein
MLAFENKPIDTRVRVINNQDNVSVYRSLFSKARYTPMIYINDNLLIKYDFIIANVNSFLDPSC